MGIKTRVTFAAAVAIAVAFLPKVEDTKYKVYTDIAGVPTVCEGITGPDVIKGKTYTRSECDALLTKHIQVAKRTVDSKIKVDVPDTFRASMYSFTFNAGGGAYSGSTMLKLTNRGRLREACEQLYRWTYYRNPKTGKMEKSKGLYNRRVQEYQLCIKDLK